MLVCSHARCTSFQIMLSNNDSDTQALLPLPVFAMMRKERDVFLHAWCSLLPCKPAVVMTPKMISLVTGCQEPAPTMVSHELLMVYRCLLWYFPELLQRTATASETAVDWKDFNQQINLGIQFHQAQLYDKNTAVPVMQFLNVYEDAILKSLFLLRYVGATDQKEVHEFEEIFPSVMNMNPATRHLLELEQFRSSTLSETSSLEELKAIETWESLADDFSEEAKINDL